MKTVLHEFSRTELLIGTAALEKLKDSCVAVFGIGGVGTFAVEALARAGVGRLVLVDDDCVCLTNINRQLHATHKTIGRPKVEVMQERILEINPQCRVEAVRAFYLPELADELVRRDYDYIVDAVDTMAAKVSLVEEAGKKDIPVISCMGAGNKLDPTRFRVTDIFRTTDCPLARIMRKQLRRKGIERLKVVYSDEKPLEPLETEESSRRKIPGSISFVPSVAGLIIAGEVVKDLIGGCVQPVSKTEPVNAET